ncbi:hypothetical protein MP228_001591 [Amoeboaphelidium protococcarum]|nr:hypothetical protein MP228_001591 [Amoeboaphelidium protococcarum]
MENRDIANYPAQVAGLLNDLDIEIKTDVKQHLNEMELRDGAVLDTNPEHLLSLSEQKKKQKSSGGRKSTGGSSSVLKEYDAQESMQVEPSYDDGADDYGNEMEAQGDSAVDLQSPVQYYQSQLQGQQHAGQQQYQQQQQQQQQQQPQSMNPQRVSMTPMNTSQTATGFPFSTPQSPEKQLPLSTEKRHLSGEFDMELIDAQTIGLHGELKL